MVQAALVSFRGVLDGPLKVAVWNPRFSGNNSVNCLKKVFWQDKFWRFIWPQVCSDSVAVFITIATELEFQNWNLR